MTEVTLKMELNTIQSIQLKQSGAHISFLYSNKLCLGLMGGNIGVTLTVCQSVCRFFCPLYFSLAIGQISFKLHGKFYYEVEMCIL